ncbi:hypothetical protein CBL_10459 [Carabus blaptoides fortunei]
MENEKQNKVNVTGSRISCAVRMRTGVTRNRVVEAHGTRYSQFDPTSKQPETEMPVRQQGCSPSGHGEEHRHCILGRCARSTNSSSSSGPVDLEMKLTNLICMVANIGTDMHINEMSRCLVSFQRRQLTAVTEHTVLSGVAEWGVGGDSWTYCASGLVDTENHAVLLADGGGVKFLLYSTVCDKQQCLKRLGGLSRTVRGSEHDNLYLRWKKYDTLMLQVLCISYNDGRRCDMFNVDKYISLALFLGMLAWWKS